MRPFPFSGVGAEHFPQPEPQPAFFDDTSLHTDHVRYAVARMIAAIVAANCMTYPTIILPT